jgi:hypothetical protein
MERRSFVTGSAFTATQLPWLARAATSPALKGGAVVPASEKLTAARKTLPKLAARAGWALQALRNCAFGEPAVRDIEGSVAGCPIQQ